MTMQSVVETPAYLRASNQAGMDDEERTEVVNVVASDPQAGVIMPGCGGARKLRIKKPGSGKSGGYRIITYFGGLDVPVYLLTVFGKGEKDSLTKAERNVLAKLTKTLSESLR